MLSEDADTNLHGVESPRDVAYQDDGVYEDVGLPPWAAKMQIIWENLMIEDRILGKGNFGEVRAGEVKVKGRFIKAAIKTLKGKHHSGFSISTSKNFAILTTL